MWEVGLTRMGDTPVPMRTTVDYGEAWNAFVHIGQQWGELAGVEFTMASALWAVQSASEPETDAKVVVSLPDTGSVWTLWLSQRTHVPAPFHGSPVAQIGQCAHCGASLFRARPDHEWRHSVA